MFESDDFDEELSQIDFGDSNIKYKHGNKNAEAVENSTQNQIFCQSSICKRICPVKGDDKSQAHQQTKCSAIDSIRTKENRYGNSENAKESTKRKIINSYFDHSNKRKFPGPAGLLNENMQNTENDNICQIELLSQDVAFSENNINCDIFDTLIWKRIKQDTANYNRIDLIRSIKAQVGNSRKRKAETVVAIVEAVDRSASDPMLLLRDLTGGIKCTLHRDAWAAFSTYIVSDCCGLVLRKPTILTTGSAFKRYYLNITLSNIYAIYSSTLIKEGLEQKPLPKGYSVTDVDGITIITCDISEDTDATVYSIDLDGLDSSMFTDDLLE